MATQRGSVKEAAALAWRETESLTVVEVLHCSDPCGPFRITIVFFCYVNHVIMFDDVVNISVLEKSRPVLVSLFPLFTNFPQPWCVFL